MERDPLVVNMTDAYLAQGGPTDTIDDALAVKVYWEYAPDNGVAFRQFGRVGEGGGMGGPDGAMWGWKKLLRIELDSRDQGF